METKKVKQLPCFVQVPFGEMFVILHFENK